MNVVIDTSVWSLALRRQRPSSDPAVHELAFLISEGRATVCGPVRQELLSGVRDEATYRRLRSHLQAFPDIALESADYENAAVFFNTCRGKGIQGSNTDFLICSAAKRRGFAILTTDTDFLRYAKHLPIRIHPIRKPVS